MIGKNISRRKILERLGEGGAGVVSRAEDITLDSTAALRLLPRMIGTEEEKDRFVRGVNAAAAPDVASEEWFS